MIVRALDVNGDWTNGKGKNDYLSGIKACEQNIATRLRCFLGDCFFDINAGVDWFNLLGSKQRVELTLAVTAVILNTQNVTGVLDVSVDLNNNRIITITYSVTTVFTRVDPSTGTISASASFILTQGGDIITTQDGDGIII